MDFLELQVHLLNKLDECKMMYTRGKISAMAYELPCYFPSVVILTTVKPNLHISIQYLHVTFMAYCLNACTPHKFNQFLRPQLPLCDDFISK